VWEFAGFFALVFFIAATVDSLVALLGGALVDRIAESARRRLRGAKSHDTAS
jgi:hypothetical protein